MHISPTVITTVASVFSSLVVIFGAVFAIYRFVIRQSEQDKEIKKLKKLLGLYEACINKGVDIDFPNSDLKAEEPSDNIY